MVNWLVEGTPAVSFRAALAIAQFVADSRQLTVPVIRHIDGEMAVCRLLEPRALSDQRQT